MFYFIVGNSNLLFFWIIYLKHIEINLTIALFSDLSKANILTVVILTSSTVKSPSFCASLSEFGNKLCQSKKADEEL